MTKTSNSSPQSENTNRDNLTIANRQAAIPETRGQTVNQMKPAPTSSTTTQTGKKS